MYFLLQKCEKNEQEKKIPSGNNSREKRLGNGAQGGKIKNVKNLQLKSREEKRIKEIMNKKVNSTYYLSNSCSLCLLSGTPALMHKTGTAQGGKAFSPW